MMKGNRLAALLCLLLLSAHCRGGDAASNAEYAKFAGMRGVNLANALEAPREGEWGVVIREEFFDAIAGAGFNMVRIPVAFALHADAAGVVSDAFMNRVEEVLDWAAGRGVTAILSFHSFGDLHREPAAHAERFLAIWEHVSGRLASRHPHCLFELLNEPHENMTAAIWNDLLARAIERVGRIDPERMLVVGGVEYSGTQALDLLAFPTEAKNVVATFHYYRPYEFTHQGASWSAGSDAWLGREWLGRPEEMEAMERDFAVAAAWSKRTGIPVLLGEFGCIRRADPESRVRWTRAVRTLSEANGFGWAVWDWSAHFSIYDAENREFDPPMLQALMGD